MTEKEIDSFEKVQIQLEGMYEEISILSKKSQTEALSLFKLKFINHILNDSNSVLGVRYKPFNDFEIFDENNIPTNSDAVMILAQYLNCFEKMRVDNITSIKTFDGNKSVYNWYWVQKNGIVGNIKTTEPKKIK
ncbi:hypothetical protein [Chryseobacterium sp. AG363]|uniref:hypothetical protein n=1 Tax=Chryseobacterium sp. AG363 TaxID=2183997 RepID=UPI000E75161A|nr:hypothetical protein [Chryseobacterium sp. AG363]RKE80589.1 hypothetical protein DEU39_0101 [Chryseobacterium sp. AG363]